MKVSTNFAPPFKLIAPFFIIGSLALLGYCIALFGINPVGLTSLHIQTLALVHLFLLGFVMMVILGSMAQLVPVVLEVEHFAVELYYAIYPLLSLGTILMVVGFFGYPILLPFGGVIAFTAFGIFLIETFLTLKKIKTLNFTTLSVLIANIFLIIGLMAGMVLALGYSGIVVVDLQRFLLLHIYFVFIGYVGVSIMGMSLVLLPMFWLSHSFSWKWVKTALIILCLGVFFIGIGSLFSIIFIENIGFIAIVVAMILYAVQILLIYITRARIEKDIYLNSMLIAFGFFALSLIFGIIYLFVQSQNILLGLGWFMFGFILFLISGHFYKIIPFLVWFERFSPYVGKKKVPMLAQMIPVKSANFQLFFSSIGWIIVGIALVLEQTSMFYSGVSFLSVGAIFLVKDIVFMIGFKE